MLARVQSTYISAFSLVSKGNESLQSSVIDPQWRHGSMSVKRGREKSNIPEF